MSAPWKSRFSNQKRNMPSYASGRRSVARARLSTARAGLYGPGHRAPAVRTAPMSLQRQVRALVASKKRDAADVTRNTATLTVTTISCLTSSADFTLAGSSTGLLDMDGDECLINSIRIKGGLSNPASLVLDQVGITDTMVRFLVVWFNKPLLVASAAGTLPPITEVLVGDTIVSLPVTAAANGGRFVILSDRTFNIGTNAHQAVTAVGYARDSGRSRHVFDYTVKVDKRIKFAAPSASGAATSGGHYDSDVAAGRVDRGLLVLYVQSAGSSSASVTMYTRLNYTG